MLKIFVCKNNISSRRLWRLGNDEMRFVAEEYKIFIEGHFAATFLTSTNSLYAKRAYDETYERNSKSPSKTIGDIV